MAEESSTSRCFALPEMVSAIIQKVYDGFVESNASDQTIFACTLVSHLWEQEANRRVWEICGSLSHDVEVPMLTNLVHIDPERRQKYAGYVRILRVGMEHTKTMMRWEGLLHRDLAHLSFPRLEELEMHGLPGTATPPWTEEEKSAFSTPSHPVPMNQYAQHRLRMINVIGFESRASAFISDEFLSAVTSRSKNLTELGLDIEDDNHNVSRDSYLTLLQTKPRLSTSV